MRPNVLLVTLDQFRGDALSCAGHPVVRTPHLDELAAAGVRFANHYAQAAPCSPGRAALYTGTYQMNNRVVANGTPLDDRFDNVARAARRAGYTPTLFGYTDQGVDPRLVTDPNDPRLSTYEWILPGFEVELLLPTEAEPWVAWLEREHGCAFRSSEHALETEPERHEDLSQSTFLTDALLGWLRRQDEPWFAHASYLRPHPPYAAAGRFATRYDAAAGPDAVPVGDRLHGLHRALLRNPRAAAPTAVAELRRLRAQYWGMCSEVDAQLGRVWQALRERGEWDNTIVVVTADHGEQLGDQGLLGKVGFFESSFHIVGIVRDPRRAAHGTVVREFTENVDIMPTLCDLLGLDVPAQCDGHPMTPFLDGGTPPAWRNAAHYEWDWRDTLIREGVADDAFDRSLARKRLAVRRSADRAFVHFGNGTSRCYDLAADPTWRTEITDPSTVLAEAQAMLDWRAEHLDRLMPGFLLENGGTGRRPTARTG